MHRLKSIFRVSMKRLTQCIALDLYVSEKMRVKRVFSVAEVSLWGLSRVGKYVVSWCYMWERNWKVGELSCGKLSYCVATVK